MQIANTEMAAAWDGPEGDNFTDHADRYDRASRRHTARLLAAAGVQPATDVLDIGCGTGAATLQAATSAEPGVVLGVDLSERMLAAARARANEAGTANLRLEQCDAQVHHFPPAAFDLAISSFGSMFFNDPVAAFTNIGSALRPGARVVLMAWRDLDENEWLTQIRAALAMGRDLPRPPAGSPGPFGLADRAQVRVILTSAGYSDVDLQPVDEPMDLGCDADDAFAFLQTFGLTRGLTEQLDDDTRSRAFDALHDLAVRHNSPEGVLIGSAAWLITARLPTSTRTES